MNLKSIEATSYYTNALKTCVKLFYPPIMTTVVQDTNMTLSAGSVDGFVTVITVDESCDTVIRHTLPVRPEMAAKDICKFVGPHLFDVRQY
jgi:hypothetical protein